MIKKGRQDVRSRQAFTAEFKLEAVRVMQEQRAMGVPLSAIGRQLEVRPDQLRSWARRAGKLAHASNGSLNSVSIKSGQLQDYSSYGTRLTCGGVIA